LSAPPVYNYFVIRAKNITLRRGVKVLLQDTDVTIHPGEHVGIVGKNGAGKSSLFAVLKGQLELDAGQLSLPPDWTIASVEQIIHDQNRPAREYVIDGDRHLRQLQMARENTSDDDGTRIAELEAALVEAGAWSAHARAEQLLAGLGFASHEWTQPIHQFSGGWQMRIALAHALMTPADLLLLDEPTNHLDLDAMLWLERWIQQSTATVLIISHDTEFLQTTAQSILHFEQQQLVRYRGGYQDFLQQRAERIRQRALAIDRQAKEAARLQGFIDRFRAQASKARQAQSRLKALERMEVLAPLHFERGVNIRLPEPNTIPDPLLSLRDANIGYAGPPTHCVIPKLDLTLRAGDRVGVLGVNGAGKSSLIKTLAGELPLLAGERHAASGLVIGYFAQQQLDMLDPNASPLEHLTRIAPDATEQELRNYLGSFGFSGDRVKEAVKPLSGGEKARLALALVVWHKPNLLLLDEPSNHLDTATREALTQALAGYGGSMLLVSHDRHLLRTTVDRLWIIADGKRIQFDGDLDDYRRWLADYQAQQRQTQRNENENDGTTASSDNLTAAERRNQRQREAQIRNKLAQQRRPLERQLAKIEKAMDAAQTRLAVLDETMADPTFYHDDGATTRDERVAILAEHGTLSKTLETLETDWLTLQEQVDALEASR